MNPPLLALNGIIRRYGAITAVGRINVTVAAGQRLAITGPNGAGKSTLLGLIDGTVTATSGKVIYDGTDITTWPTHRRARAGIARVFQHPQVAARHTVLGNILLGVHRHHRTGTALLPPRRAAARLMREMTLHLADQTGLRTVGTHLAGHLSYGHRRQLDLAMALAGQPRLLLLDEPTAGLSDHETERITRMLSALPDTMTVLIVEHDPAVAARITTTTLQLNAGQPTAEGGPA
ncbi:ABC transporter ATP-binding protein [Catellatospora bangladeshensis]|uniref:ABC transporter ATP-binding protein n=1 Tax=Catellatospora bangladeshensis TaxID=310355 RepID=A0A8J3NPK4_9ACTN|nr:ATP-binding cassette domain-containing protein [Catellatospora bangladeshensis]GIF86045.1 ABC transporter ATP-binding protein [Catellatospora bangladeshensis]